MGITLITKYDECYDEYPCGVLFTLDDIDIETERARFNEYIRLFVPKFTEYPLSEFKGSLDEFHESLYKYHEENSDADMKSDFIDRNYELLFVAWLRDNNKTAQFHKFRSNEFLDIGKMWWG